MKTHTKEAVVAAIKEEIEKSSLRQVAKAKGFSAGFISDIVRGNRTISDNVATAFGFVREVQPEVVRFRKAV